MKKLVFATRNPGKIVEMRELLDGLGIAITSLAETGIDHDTVEDQDSFVGNALKKAREAAELTGEWAVADDSGICIDALSGRPGVFSARWAGENAGDRRIIRHTLEQLDGVSDDKRQASFHSVAALVAPDGREWIFEGVVSGRIMCEPVGTHKPKLPYDVLFCPDGYDRTYAQMSDKEKNGISHRGQSFSKLKAFLEDMTRNG